MQMLKCANLQSCAYCKRGYSAKCTITHNTAGAGAGAGAGAALCSLILWQLAWDDFAKFSLLGQEAKSRGNCISLCSCRSKESVAVVAIDI